MTSRSSGGRRLRSASTQRFVPEGRALVQAAVDEARAVLASRLAAPWWQRLLHRLGPRGILPRAWSQGLTHVGWYCAGGHLNDRGKEVGPSIRLDDPCAYGVAVYIAEPPRAPGALARYLPSTTDRPLSYRINRSTP